MATAPGASRPPRLSAFVCARDEAACLAACLASLRFADEVVVLLDRCSDGSAPIAQALADRVIEGIFPWEGPRRAAAQAACTGEWVLEIDADERVPADLAAEIQARLGAAVPGDWYLLPVDNYIGDRLVRHGWGGSFGTSAVARLYRRGHKSWGEQQVHPSVRLAGQPGGRLRHAIEHRVDANVSGMLRRLDRYTRLRAADLHRRPGERRSLASHAVRGLRRFWKCYITRRGYREGDWGVLIALMAALYPLLSELRARLEPDPLPAEPAAVPAADGLVA